jgi:hypothetical protein
MRIYTAAAVVTAALWTCSAHAACDGGNVDAEAIPYVIADKGAAEGFGESIRMAFTEWAYLHVKGLTLGQPACAAATFSIGALHYTLYADDNAVFARRAAGTAGGAYLIATLAPETAAKASRVLSVSMGAGGLTFIKVNRKDLVYVLVASSGSKQPWSVFGLFDNIPDTPRLAQLMCQAALGSLPVAATYDPSDKTVTLKDLSALPALADVGRAGGPCTVELLP